MSVMAGVMAAAALASCAVVGAIPETSAVQARATEYAKAAGINISPVVFTRSTAPAGSPATTVDGSRDVRCYFLADLTTTHRDPAAAGVIIPPYVSVAGLTTADASSPADAAKACAQSWDTGFMNPAGITNDLIPQGFASPTASTPAPNGATRDKNGNLLPPKPINLPGQPPITLEVRGYYIPPLMTCVVDGAAAVIPGPGEVCATLGIPALKK